MKILDPKIKFSEFDLDRDGVINQNDCDPYDPKKQHVGYGNPGKIRLLKGYNIDDYYYDGNTGKYVLRPGAKKYKRGIFG